MDPRAPDILPHERVTDPWRTGSRHRSRPSRESAPTRPRHRNVLRFAVLALLATLAAPSALADRMPLPANASGSLLRVDAGLPFPERSAALTRIERAMVAAERGALLAARELATPAESRTAPNAATDRITDYLRWWLALTLTGVGVMLLVLAWSVLRGRRVRRARRQRAADPDPVLEYFPDCSLIDLHGITGKPVHRLSAKFNMITRLQNPAVDSINYIQVLRRQISRRHALIEYRDFSFWITDQDSLNGTFVNDERIHDETRLKHGDRIRFHTYAFEFCVSDLVLSNETLVGGKLTNMQ